MARDGGHDARDRVRGDGAAQTGQCGGGEVHHEIRHKIRYGDGAGQIHRSPIQAHGEVEDWGALQVLEADDRYLTPPTPPQNRFALGRFQHKGDRLTESLIFALGPILSQCRLICGYQI